MQRLVIGAATMLLPAAVTACHPVVGEGRTEAGTVRLHVVDTSSRGIAGVPVTFQVPREPEIREVTDSSGRVETHGTQGTWRITVTPPAGYSVPSAQSNPLSVRVRRLHTTEVTVHLSGNSP